MMVSADEDEVVDVGRATVANPVNVVGLASGRVGTTTDAATVSGDEGTPLGAVSYTHLTLPTILRV